MLGSRLGLGLTMQLFTPTPSERLVSRSQVVYDPPFYEWKAKEQHEFMEWLKQKQSNHHKAAKDARRWITMRGEVVVALRSASRCSVCRVVWSRRYVRQHSAVIGRRLRGSSAG
jgi:hypothetical protein